MVGLPLILLLKGRFIIKARISISHIKAETIESKCRLWLFFKKYSYRLTLSQNFSCAAVLYRAAYKSDTRSISSAYH